MLNNSVLFDISPRSSFHCDGSAAFHHKILGDFKHRDKVKCYLLQKTELSKTPEAKNAHTSL